MPPLLKKNHNNISLCLFEGENIQSKICDAFGKAKFEVISKISISIANNSFKNWIIRQVCMIQ